MKILAGALAGLIYQRYVGPVARPLVTLPIRSSR
jgi:hypothetical protein